MPPYIALPAEESDIPALMLTSSSAFANEPYQDSVFPSHETPTGQAFMAAQTLEQWRANPYQTIVKSVDTATGEIVGMAIWNVYDKERGSEEWDREPDVSYLQHLGEGSMDRARLFLGRTAETRKKIWKGRRHVLLALLCIHVSHQRRGAGASLVQWGIDRADEAGVPAYMEASPFGRPLYRKFGFREIEREVMVVKAEEFNGDVDAAYMPMVRPVPGTSEGGDLLEGIE